MSKLRRVVLALKEALRQAAVRVLPGWALDRWLLARLPRAVNAEATTACNLACPLCPTHIVPRAHRYLKELHVERLAAGNPALRSVCFHVMGEPLLHPRLFEFVARLRALGVQSHFGTNGVLLARRIDEVLRSGLASISVAIDGADARDHARYRQGADLDAVIAGTKQLLAERRRRGLSAPHVQVKAVMFAYNEEREDDVRATLASVGADSVQLKHPSYFTDDEAWHGGESRVDPQKSARAIARARAFVREVRPDARPRRWSRPDDPADPLLARNQRMCPQLARATVLADGRVVPCGMDALGSEAFGSLEDQTLVEIWRGPARRALLRRFRERRLDLCRLCTLRCEPAWPRRAASEAAEAAHSARPARREWSFGLAR